MLRKIKLSVLTPIYKHDIRYVRECLESLRTQTIKEIEFVLIDNGASIEAKNLINEYQRKDERFRSIHLSENLGYGVALNCGLLEARGEYIGIVESDDSILPNMYQTLYNIASKYKCDVVKCDWISYLGKDSPQNSPRHNFPTEFCNKLITPREYPKLFLSDPAIWTGIYEKKFLKTNDLKFIESPTARYQDTSFNFKVLALAQRAYFLDEQFVNYRRNTPNSSVKDLSAVFSLVEEYDEIENFLKNKTDIYQKLIYVKNYNKFRSYRWNYSRTQGKVRTDFLKIFRTALEESVSRKECDRCLFSDDEVRWLEQTVGVRFFLFCNDNINIVFSFDKNYFSPALVAISSLLDAAKKRVAYNFYLFISADVSDKELTEMKKLISYKSPLSKVVFCEQGGLFDNGYETRGITKAAYYRLMLHHILSDVDFVVYSDVDVLFRADLSELRKLPMQKYAMAAVKDVSINQKINWEALEKKFPYWKAMLKGVFPNYKNSGFLYLNLSKLRQYGWENDIISYSKLELNFQDQDVLNILTEKYRCPVYYLSPKYICMPKHINWGNYEKALNAKIITKRDFFDVKYSPAIYHYPGPTKPWSSPSEPYNRNWCRYVISHHELLERFPLLLKYQNNKGLLKIMKHKFFTVCEKSGEKVKYFLGLPYDKKITARGRVRHDHLFFLFSTVKTERCIKFYFLGFQVAIRKKSNDKKVLQILGIPFCYSKKLDKKAYLQSHSNQSIINTDGILSGIERRNTELLLEYFRKLDTSLDDLKEFIYESSFIPIKVSKQHSRVLPPYRNIYQNRDVILCGTGPSLNHYSQIPNAIHIGLNRAYENSNLSLDYIFAWDIQGLLRSDNGYLDKIKKTGAQVILGLFINDELTQSSQDHIRELNALVLYSSARHGFLPKAVDPVIHRDIEIYPLMDFLSVAFGAFHFALYTNPRRIFLVGIDNNLSGYFNKNHKQEFLKIDQIKEGWKKVKKFTAIHYPSLEIISVNPDGLKGIFTDVYTTSYLRCHPEIKNGKNLNDVIS